MLIGARLFTLLSSRSANGHGDVLLGLLFVAAVAIVCGFLANRFRRWFVVWTTALAGSACCWQASGTSARVRESSSRPGVDVELRHLRRPLARDHLPRRPGAANQALTGLGPGPPDPGRF